MMRLLNYAGVETRVDVDLDDPSVLGAFMHVVSGDEVLDVLYDDHEETYDASELTGIRRIEDIEDYGYPVVLDGKWMTDREAFLSRRDSYWSA